MKDFYYDYGYNFIKIFKDKEVPNFIKEASSLEQEELSSLPDSAFASEGTRSLPITDPANVFVSAAYYYGANTPNNDVEQKIIKAASFFDILEDVERLREDIKNENSVNNKTASDNETWEISLTQQNGKTIKYAGDSTNIEKFSNEFISNLINKCSFNEKVECAEKIATELSRFNKNVPQRILQVSGRNITNTQKLAEQVKARAVRLFEDSDKVTLCKIADALEQSEEKTLDGMRKIAEILETIDQQNKLQRFYGKSIQDPFESVFNTSVEDAQKMAGIVELGGEEYSMLDLELIEKEIFKSALTKEAFEEIGIGTESEDLSKISKLSEDQKSVLASYL
jgi:hypothetical protein